MIAAVCWVPRGAANPVPQPIDPPSAQELQALMQLHGDAADSKSNSDGDMDDEMAAQEKLENIESGTSDNPVATALAAASALGCDRQKALQQHRPDDIADELAELDMDNYDNEDEDIELFGNGGLGAAYYPSNDMDPYILDKDSEDEEEIEDMTIKPSDFLILTARNEDDVSHLEMWVYEDETEDGIHNMYVHHDVMLPAFPLCVAWLDCDLKGGEKGNYVAIGTMHPEIEIWDLDLLDAVEPAVVLGGRVGHSSAEQSNEKKKKKKKKVAKLKEGSHSDAVLSLAWNNEYRNVLASASADCSIKIWDIATQKCEHTICCHSDKVQSVAWNVHEPTVLLSGSFDRTVSLLDMRAPAHEGVKWSVSADVESLCWDPHTDNFFVVSLEDGTVCGHDIRAVSAACPSSGQSKGGKALFTLHAHDKAVCTVMYNPTAPHGAVFAAAFCKDSPFLLALGGSKGNLDVWDTLTETEVIRRFGKFGLRKAQLKPS